MPEKLAEALNILKQHNHGQPQIGIITGSGLGGLVEEFKNPVRIRFKDIPNFPVSSVNGHRGEVVFGMLAGAEIFALSGRVHFYEGYVMQQVVFPVRVMAAFNVKKIIITNAAGAVNASYTPGEIVAIRDHINMMGDSPLSVCSDFIDLTGAYNNELRNLTKKTARRLGLPLPSGVYAAISGPSYETPAEIRALRRIGADMVGMSTVPEVIMANRLGMQVLGLAVITNMAAGMNAKPLSHKEVIEAATSASPKIKALVKGIIKSLKYAP